MAAGRLSAGAARRRAGGHRRSSPARAPVAADPGWQPLVRSLALRNLTPDEGRAYLTQRSIPEAELPAVLDFTHSYPLALSLVADLYDQRPGFHFRPETAPDIVEAAHRAALGAGPGARPIVRPWRRARWCG